VTDDPNEGYIHMKPLLGAIIQRAVALALEDTLAPGDTYDFSAEALGQNVACRLLGCGGWTVHGVYAGNASVFDLLMASIPDADVNPLDEILDYFTTRGIDASPFTKPSDLSRRKPTEDK